MDETSFQNLTEILTQGKTPRVWSLLVTVFGELAQDDDARISGSLLRHLSDHIGIKPEAMRVALHRLRKDGWIDSARKGRTSAYFLTPWGREQSSAASPRIYAKHSSASQAWLVIFDPAQPAANEVMSGAWVSTNMLVTSTKPDDGNVFATLLTAKDALPSWVTSKVCRQETVVLSQDFLTALEKIQTSLEAFSALNPLQIAALRVLLVHGWRRIILKVPILPDHVFPEHWCGVDCRLTIGRLLDFLPKRNLTSLEHFLAVAEPSLQVKRETNFKPQP